jgi:hypothetical protein
MSERLLLATVIGSLFCLMAEPAWAVDKAACVAAAQDGQELRDAKRFGDAREKLLLCAQAGCPDVVRDDCTAWLADVEAKRSSLVFTAKDAAGNDLSEVRVTANGKRLLEKLDGSSVFVDPGEYTLLFESGGRQSEKKVVVAEGQKARAIEVVIGSPAEVEAPPAVATDGGPKVAPIVFVSIGAAGLIAFAVLQGLAQSEYADLEDGCGATRSCSDADVSGTEAKFVASGVMLGVGGAAVATAVILWIVDAASKPNADANKPRVSASVTPEGAFFGVSVPLDL